MLGVVIVAAARVGSSDPCAWLGATDRTTSLGVFARVCLSSRGAFSRAGMGAAFATGLVGVFFEGGGVDFNGAFAGRIFFVGAAAFLTPFFVIFFFTISFFAFFFTLLCK
jgi:hypothetical protein